MRRTWLLCLLLTGCQQSDDLDRYLAEVRARPAAPIEPLPVATSFEPLPYTAQRERSPFIEPKPEQRSSEQGKPECQQLGADGPRQPLEQYALENLVMTGSLARSGELWALIGTPDGRVIKVGKGQKLGLHHGVITAITANSVALEETVPDGKGCWVLRQTQLVMTTGDKQS